MFSDIGKYLGFEKEFCEKSFVHILENKHISEDSVFFTNKVLAGFFISDIMKLVNQTEFEITRINEWLKQTAELNNADITI